jgi:hypothetical protein
MMRESTSGVTRTAGMTITGTTENSCDVARTVRVDDADEETAAGFVAHGLRSGLPVGRVRPATVSP